MILDFNKGWFFCKEGGEPVPVDLPHDAMLTEPRRADCPSGVNGGYFPGGVYVYEKTFELAQADLGKSVVLHFEGVYQNCTVSVNGRAAGGHRYGYTPFDVDLSELVRAGENRVSVRVDNSLQPNCRWYTGSGIYRPVTLLIRDKNHIERLHIRTVSIDPAVVCVDTDADTVELYDGETLMVSGPPGELTVPNAKLWTAETPHLYTCVAKSQTDERRASFGVRTLRWSGKEGLLVNGQSVKLRGGCIHHDHGVLGAAEYRESEERRIRILRENGFNAVRIAHNPASQITLDACDKLGMYVMDEGFDGWYTPKTYHDYSRHFWEDWRGDAAAMVGSAYNHPSVILYSIGNEVTETAGEKGIRLCGEMRDFVRRLDDTRPVTAGINVLLDVYIKWGLGIYKDKGGYKAELLPEGKRFREKRTGSAFFNYWAGKLGRLMFLLSRGKTAERVVRDIAPALDIVGLNYASSRYDIDSAKYPNRLMVGSETMSADLPYNWARVEKYPQIIGDFVWAAWDYLGETCMGWTYQSYKGLPLLAGQGMIDITGLPLAQMAFLQVAWGLRKEPYLAVRPLNHASETPATGAWQFTNALPSWTWQGYEGKKAVVEVYTDTPRARLLLNGKEIGTKAVKDCKAIFTLLYAPGTLRAEALDGAGRVLSATELKTGGDETVLTIKPEKTVVSPGEVFYVPVEFADNHGELKPYIEQRVEIAAENAVLLGFGSALTKTDEVFDKPYHDAYRGRALAVFRAGAAGKISITAKSAGFAPAAAEVEVR